MIFKIQGKKIFMVELNFLIRDGVNFLKFENFSILNNNSIKCGDSKNRVGLLLKIDFEVLLD